jgi:adenylate cyclase
LIKFTTYNKKIALYSTIIWLILGLLAFSFEALILDGDNIDYNFLTTFSFYVLPPLVLGYPIALLDIFLFDHQKEKYSFRSMIIYKGVFYLISIVFVYTVIGCSFHFLEGKSSSQYSIYLFVSKFIFIWSIAIVIKQFFVIVYAHVDEKTFRNWLLGKYYHPGEEQRIFLFVDINNSTKIAETLDSNRYFQFLNEFHLMVESSLTKYHGELYQYIGDEAVITWNLPEGLANNNAIDFFFDLEERIERSSHELIEKYGFAPYFKGAVHYGMVTRGEMGSMKKDFAFVGDVLNTTSRMYSLCKDKNVSLVISRRLLNLFSDTSKYISQSHDYFKPKGRDGKIFIFSLKRKPKDLLAA